MANEAHFSVVGFVATLPKAGWTKTGTRSLSMRVGWTPRLFDRTTNQWTDQPSSFITVQCYRKVADNAATCLRRGDPIVLRGTLRVREFVDDKGVRRSSVEVLADSIGHDLSRGITTFGKPTAQSELTAAERERALAAAAAEGRSPLPGDMPDPESAGTAETDPDYPAALEPDGRDGPDYLEPEGGAESGPAGTEMFDDAEARGVLAEAAEPVGAVG